MAAKPFRICVVGSGMRFLSGISYYTLRLTNALARTHDVSVILMRQLLPTRLYPGKDRVGAPLTRQQYDPHVRLFNGVDWHWLPSIFPALLLLVHQRPQVLIFQWWTGTVLHTYLLLALVARLLGTKVVIEFHEVFDTGEARLLAARLYVHRVMPLLVRLAHGYVIHSEYDRPALEQHYHLGDRPTAVIPHGPYDQYQTEHAAEVYREAPPDCCNLLFFGVIRPYKGLEDLITAFHAIPADQIDRYWLTVVGEPWENWTRPLELIASSPYRDRITLVDRYVPDEEVAAYFAGADAVVLPYHRSSSSGPLHVAMSHGLPLIVTKVGGLVEASEGYAGAILVPPQDADSLREALEQVARMRGQHFTDPHSWDYTVEKYERLFEIIHPARQTTQPSVT